ncbi:MAG: S8 family serine peptidase [Gammaproteobacteria bacterium]|nr:S8 family serine peptidase [Gammaproteobacteria bacterium]
MKKLYKIFLSTPFLIAICANAKFGIELHEGHEVVANQVLVKFKSGIVSKAAATEDIRKQEDIDSDEDIGGIGVRKFHSRSINVTQLIERLKVRQDVEYVEPDHVVYAVTVPNDPSFSVLWGIQNSGQVVNLKAGIPGADVNVVPAWSYTTGSKANVVAIIDTGINYNHPDLAANIWTAPNAFQVLVGGTVYACAAGTHGFNVITKSCDPFDDNSHGSHVAGTIGAIGNNGLGMVGINQTTRMMGLKFLNASGSGSVSDAITAIEFAIQAKTILGVNANIRVLNNSWGCLGNACYSASMESEIIRANSYDILFVAAAGNNGNNNDLKPFYPANYASPNIISVAAIDNQDQFASFSNYGRNTVHLGAPGVDIYSTMLGNTYGYLSGTSMATPHVTGAAALLLSKCQLNTSGIRNAILNNTVSISALSGITMTGGRLNVNSALQSCLPVIKYDYLPVIISYILS